MVLADSSVVILALPEILREFDVDIPSVAWVITSFNLVLALVAVPAALIGRRRPREVCAVGLLVFAAASLACALAPSFDVPRRRPLRAGDRRRSRGLRGAGAAAAHHGLRGPGGRRLGHGRRAGRRHRPGRSAAR